MTTSTWMLVKIERFGLNADFVDHHGITWIDGLITGSGKDLGQC